MKKHILILLPITILFFAFIKQDPIKKEQLLQPQEMANMINNPKAVKPVQQVLRKTGCKKVFR